MAIPAIPTNFIVQQGNGQVLLTWSISPGALNYVVQRSTDNVSFSTINSPVPNQFLDMTVTVGTQYFYRVASSNTDGQSSFTNSQSAVPTFSGQLSLGQLRLMSQQRADRVGSQFVTTSEWNTYINQSYFELYDLLVTVYEDYYLAAPLSFQTDGINQFYDLPNGFNYSGAEPFYKLMGVDVGLDNGSNAFVTLKKFDFIARNRYVFPNISSTYLGVFNMQYRVLGNQIEFIPTPAAAQFIRLWYIPRLTQLLQDTDIADGVSGWTEYLIVDAAIKALQKEESDVTVLQNQKMMLLDRINSSAMNRDVGQADTISNVRTWSERWGGFGGVGYDGPTGGL